MEHEVEGVRSRGRPRRTWRKVAQNDCQTCKLNRKDAKDFNRWRKHIKDD